MKCECGRTISQKDRDAKRYVTSRATGKHYGKCCYLNAGRPKKKRARSARDGRASHVQENVSVPAGADAAL